MTNFVFVRHSFSCNNSIPGLVRNGELSKNGAKDIKGIDPVLSVVGVKASKHNGKILDKILKQIFRFSNNPSFKMENFDIVGCSPLLRSMESAYFLTRSWKNPPTKIYVFPLLREIDESSNDKYSKQSIKRINNIPGYMILDIPEQKRYLSNLGILDYFDFQLFEKSCDKNQLFKKSCDKNQLFKKSCDKNQNLLLRNEPGDIPKFINWFQKQTPCGGVAPLNIFIVTHSGVLKSFANESFVNNSGIFYNVESKKMISLNPLLKFFDFFTDYTKFNNSKNQCNNNSNRCDELCNKLTL